jgi:two-component system response regulator AtoC
LEAARIAIVDDDSLFVEYLSMFVKSRGYDVVVYTSGPALLQALASGAPPDVVLLDVLMPSMDGLETLRTLRGVHPRLPVIMVSGQQVPATIVDAVRLGAIDYVVKPDDVAGVQEAALEATICRALERVTLTDEVARLAVREPEDPDGSQPCWHSGHAMADVMTMVERVADNDVSVLLTGESGVGKEVIARELHRRSARRPKPFVKVNCAALPSELLESELFGHERGAFTGAQAPRVGKFEYANGGTLLLDEIGEMPVGMQAKLLQVLQDGEITKLGSNRSVMIDVRVLAATNRDLDAMIQTGQFRADLYYRLQVIEIHVPPLRERREEIPALVEFFLRRYAERYGRPLIKPSAAMRDAILSYDWPGNVRELENMIKRFVILRDETVLLELDRQRPAATASTPATVFAAAATVAAPVVGPATAPVNGRVPGEAFHAEPPARLPELARAAALIAEREAIQHALDHFRWNRRKAAQLLGVSYKTLLSKMKECGISAPTDNESTDV